jgi:outer membrane lipopolysaccharide assembly protein LptE/RlpB
MTRLLALALAVTQLTACGSLLRDRRDAPWDTARPGKPIIEQLPNWEHPYGKWPCYDPYTCKKT